MAVFTVVELNEFRSWAAKHYGLHNISALTSISEGIENTNYRVTNEAQDYVFTILELWDNAATRYYAALMRHLNQAALPIPSVLDSTDSTRYPDWHGKPGLIVPFAPGSWIAEPQDSHCEIMGDMLARMHIAAADFTAEHPNPRGNGWRRQAAKAIRQHLSADLQQLLDTTLNADNQFSSLPLPHAACHCDLFRNNVLWQSDGRISAIIDFYFGGHDSLLFDLAVCVCDWCYRDGDFSPPLLAALLRGYTRRRRFCSLEKAEFANALNSAAGRFWISRHYDILFPRQAQTLQPHDPTYFENILRTIHRNSATFTDIMEATG